MEILSVFDSEFKDYGKVIEGYDTSELITEMLNIPLPETKAYKPSIASLEYCRVFGQLQNNLYGGMPIQVGICWGRNSRLECLEYHRDSEVNVGTHDFILLLAKMCEMENGVIDTGKVRAFRVPAGVLVEVYSTTLHFTPCHTDLEDGYRVAVVLPKGTNSALPEIDIKNEEDKRLFGCNKWLLAHPDSERAKQGAYVGMKGKLIDLTD